MKSLIKSITIVASITLVSACGETWYCITDGDIMYSRSASGEIGSADKGCSCEEMRNFEYRQFGEVDEQALKNDFGC